MDNARNGDRNNINSGHANNPQTAVTQIGKILQ